jgi:hypothetical protein
MSATFAIRSRSPTEVPPNFRTARAISPHILSTEGIALYMRPHRVKFGADQTGTPEDGKNN